MDHSSKLLSPEIGFFLSFIYVFLLLTILDFFFHLLYIYFFFFFVSIPGDAA